MQGQTGDMKHIQPLVHVTKQALRARRGSRDERAMLCCCGRNAAIKRCDACGCVVTGRPEHTVQSTVITNMLMSMSVGLHIHRQSVSRVQLYTVVQCCGNCIWDQLKYIVRPTRVISVHIQIQHSEEHCAPVLRLRLHHCKLCNRPARPGTCLSYHISDMSVMLK